MIFGVRQDLTIIWNLFFFSSRRRHTRWPRDWSSDVCSSDLHGGPVRATTVARAQCCCLRRREPTGSLCPVDRGAGGGPGADRLRGDLIGTSGHGVAATHVHLTYPVLPCGGNLHGRLLRRNGLRPAHRRSPAGVLLVGLDLPGQRTDRPPRRTRGTGPAEGSRDWYRQD